MSTAITSAETFRRTVSALSETMKMLDRENAYPSHVRYFDRVTQLEAHRDTLAAAIRAYVDNGGAVA